MYVPDDRDRRLYVHHIAFLHQQLFRLGAYRLDDGVGEELFSVEACDAFVEVYAGCRRSALAYHVVTARSQRAGEVEAYQEGQAWLMS